MEPEQLSAAERVTLAALSDAARAGATDEGLGAMFARLAGEPMITLDEVNGGPVQVKVSRVHGVGPRFGGGTVLVFTELEAWDPKYRLEVENDQHKVVRALRENGWKY